MNQKQVIGIVLILSLAAGLVLMNQTPQNIKNDKLDMRVANFERLKSEANLINRDFYYNFGKHGSGKDFQGPDRDQFRDYQRSLESIRKQVHSENASFRARYNQDFHEFRDVDQQIDGLLSNIKNTIQQIPVAKPFQANLQKPLPQDTQQRPQVINIDKSVHHNEKTYNEAQRLQQIRQGDRNWTGGTQTQNVQGNLGQTHNGGDLQWSIGHLGHETTNKAVDSYNSMPGTQGAQPVTINLDVDMIPAAQASIAPTPNNGNSFDGKPPSAPDTAPTNVLNKDNTAHIPSIPITGSSADHQSRGTNALLNTDDETVTNPDILAGQGKKPPINQPKVPALPRSHTQIGIPPEKVDKIANPYLQNTVIPPEHKPDVEMIGKQRKGDKPDLGRKRSASLVIEKGETKRPKVKPTPASKPIGNERTQTQIDIPDKLKVVVTDNQNVVVPPQPVVSSQATGTNRAVTGFTSVDLPESPPDVPDKPPTPKKKKKGRLDGYQIAVQTKAKQVIDEIKVIEKNMEESTTEVDQEMIRNFWAKYRDLKYTVPDTIEVFPNLKSKIVKPKVVITDNKHNRFFSNLWDNSNDKLDSPYVIHDNTVDNLYDLLREYNISATNVKARSPSYNIWKKAIDQVEHERRKVSVLTVKVPKY